MNQIAADIDGNDDLMSPFEGHGYSDRQIAHARRLLATLGYQPESSDWSERCRFLLFDKLAKIALNHAVAAERNGRTVSDYAVIAQCAMEMVSNGRAFSPTILAEVCGSEPAFPVY